MTSRQTNLALVFVAACFSGCTTRARSTETAAPAEKPLVVADGPNKPGWPKDPQPSQDPVTDQLTKMLVASGPASPALNAKAANALGKTVSIDLPGVKPRTTMSCYGGDGIRPFVLRPGVRQVRGCTQDVSYANEKLVGKFDELAMAEKSAFAQWDGVAGHSKPRREGTGVVTSWFFLAPQSRAEFKDRPSK